jgi:hypothetical protein
MARDFQRLGGVSEQYSAPRPDWLTDADIAEAEAQRAEYYRDFVARVDAEQAEAENIARTRHWFSANGCWERTEKRDDRTYEEAYGVPPAHVPGWLRFNP